MTQWGALQPDRRGPRPAFVTRSNMRLAMGRVGIALGTAVTFFTAVVLALAADAAPADVPAGAVYSQEYVTSPDGTKLHADLLRPATARGPRPVLLLVS